MPSILRLAAIPPTKERDENGNVVEESEFGGSPHVFVIQELAEVCE